MLFSSSVRTHDTHTPHVEVNKVAKSQRKNKKQKCNFDKINGKFDLITAITVYTPYTYLYVGNNIMQFDICAFIRVIVP